MVDAPAAVLASGRATPLTGTLDAVAFDVLPTGMLITGLPAEDCGFDLMVGEHRIWSFRTRAGSDRQHVAWHPELLAHLHGHGVLGLRDSATTRLLASRDVALFPADEPLAVVDDEGRWLSVNKWGRLGAAFDGRDDGIQERLLQRLVALIETVRGIGVEPFVVYGTLLGAARCGDLLAHDDDADIAYLSSHADPLDVAVERLALQRALAAEGLETVSHSLGHLQVIYRRDGGVDHYIDIFTAFETDGHLHLPFHVRVPADGVRVLPLGTVTIRGLRLPAPADPTALLAATYGPGWRVPDPSFRFNTPTRTRVLFRDWLGEFNMSRDHWENFYGSSANDRVPDEPSAFARTVARQLTQGSRLLDVGTGTGRDALHLARLGHRVHAVDYSPSAVRRLEGAASSESLPLTASVVNIADLSDVLRLTAALPSGGPWSLYARFFLHAIDDDARANFWVLARAITRTGGTCWLEFRETDAAQVGHEFGDHFRNSLRLVDVLDEARSAGMAVAHSELGRGLAVYRDEDPLIARVHLVGQPVVADVTGVATEVVTLAHR